MVFTQELESQGAEEGHDAVLRCVLSKAGVALEWKKGELCLCPCAKYDISQTGLSATLVFHDVDPEDSGNYTCDSGDRQSTAQLAVKGMLLTKPPFIPHDYRNLCVLLQGSCVDTAVNRSCFSPPPPLCLLLPLCFCLTLPAQPILFTSQLVGLKAEAGQTAVLRCETTKPGAGVVWRHGDLVLEPDSRHQLRREGTVAELLIHKLQLVDSGEYSCDTGSHRTRAVLTVLGRRI